MKIEIEIPDEIAQALNAGDLSLVALEAIALEGYRSGRLGDGLVQRLLGFATPMQAHAFLKEHGVYLNYSAAELEKDSAALEVLLGPATVYRKRSA